MIRERLTPFCVAFGHTLDSFLFFFCSGFAMLELGKGLRLSVWPSATPIPHVFEEKVKEVKNIKIFSML